MNKYTKRLFIGNIQDFYKADLKWPHGILADLEDEINEDSFEIQNGQITEILGHLFLCTGSKIRVDLVTVFFSYQIPDDGY